MKLVHPIWLWAVAALGVACGPDTFAVTLNLQDDAGAPLADGWARIDGVRFDANRDGAVRLEGLTRPVLALVGGPGRIVEPVPVGRDDAENPLAVTVMARNDRRVLHFGGDVMLGRRYLEPSEGAPLLRKGHLRADARAVMGPLAEAFAAADLSMVNLETVLGDADADAAYPAKRWLLQSPVETVDALEALGVDAVTLANNHLYDWEEAGITSTRDALAAGGLPAAGAGASAAVAEMPLIVEVDGFKVGVVARTSVDGDWVNDQYPQDDDILPEPIDPATAALWTSRDWGWQSADGSASIPVEARRIGSAWKLLTRLERDLSASDQQSLWMSARAVYPELQDWVARRGHGGAARWSADQSPADIAALASEVDFVVVQLHMGFQFAEAPADAARQAAKDAVAAGADLVVMHHPHVLQGIEWVDGVPVVFSLGNLVFDQDFLSTFGSGILRVVVQEDGTIDQVRMLPVWIDNYIPAPVTGDLGDRLLHQMWERSQQGWTSIRTDEGRVFPQWEADAARAPQQAIWEYNTLRFVDNPTTPVERTVRLAGSTPTSLPTGWLLQRPLPGGEGLEVGRALLGLGHFEDEDTDGIGDELVGWKTYSDDAHLTRDDADRGLASLELVGRPDKERTTARMWARAPIPAHRVYAADQTPLDGDARYSIHLRAWGAGETDIGLVRVALYNFDDSDPSAAPISTFIDEIALPFPLPDEEWTTVDLELPTARLSDANGLRANFALVYVSARQTERRSSVLRFDNLELIEWRSAAVGTGSWERADYLRGGYGPFTVDVLSWSAP